MMEGGQERSQYYRVKDVEYSVRGSKRRITRDTVQYQKEDAQLTFICKEICVSVHTKMYISKHNCRETVALIVQKMR